MRGWAEMSHEEFVEELESGREEAQRRMQQMAALLGMAQPSGKPGRPPKSTAYRFGGADQEGDQDDASGAGT